MDTLPAVVFDYGALDASTHVWLQQTETEITVLMLETQDLAHRYVTNVLQLGARFGQVRDCLRHNKAGGFEGWLDGRGWSRRTAYNYISAYERFGNCATVAQFDIAPKALYLLSAPSTPEPARQEALSRAETGESITHQLARAIVQQHAAPPAPDVATNDDTAAMPRTPTFQPPAMDTPARMAPTDRWDWPDDATTIDPDAPASASDDAWAWDTPTTLTDIARLATPYGLLVEPHPDGVILRWPEEDPTKLAVLSLDEADAWLDEQADDLAAHRAARAAKAVALPDDYLSLARAVLDTDRAPQTTLSPTLHDPSILTPEVDDVQAVVDQLLTAAASMSAPAAVVLLPATTAAPWFHALAERATLCFVRAETDASAGGLVAYFGPDTARFAAIFGAVGVVVRRIAP